MTADLSTLCAACGACCDGTIFARCTLEPEEATSLRKHLALEPDSSTFRQPCTAHGIGGCGIYEARPATCRRYRCKLHQEVGDGQVTLDDALARVRRIRQLSSEIDTTLAPGRGSDLWQRLSQQAGTSPAEIARLNERLALHVAELAMRLDRDLGVGSLGAMIPTRACSGS
jgi:Fe-S-cluster containining protein